MEDLPQKIRKFSSRKAVEKHLQAARKNRRFADFSNSEIRNIDLSGLDLTCETFDGSFNTRFIKSDLRGSNFSGCNLVAVDFASANLRGAKIKNAEMRKSNLYNALLEGTNLTGSNLSRGNLYSAELVGTVVDDVNFTKAQFGQTSIARLDLSKANNLNEATHRQTSPIDSEALRLTGLGLRHQPDSRRREIFRFLANTGMSDETLSLFRSSVSKPYEFFSVFISHSSKDKKFAKKIYGDLQAAGINCWFDEHEILPGHDILDEIDKGIRIWEKMVLICSKNSLSPQSSWWVEQEIERALSKERSARKAGLPCKPTLIPIAIDNYLNSGWQSRYKASVVALHVGDFRRWKDSRAYSISLQRLILATDKKSV